MKVGLVLEGGSMRGMYTAGVLDVMMESGIEVDGAIGVSAGALFGCNYKSRQIGRAIRYNMQYCNDPRYVGMKNLFFTGDLYGADFCYEVLPKTLDVFDSETFRNNPMEFYVVCTNVATGQPVYRKCEKGFEDLQWFRASGSMPMVSRIVKVDGYELLDGGIADSIPARYFAEELGYRRSIVILTQPEGFIKEKNPLLPLLRVWLWNHPNICEALATRHDRYNEALRYVAQKEQTGEFFVIRPSRKLEVGAVEHDPQKLKEVYDLGRADAQKHLEAMRRFIEDARASS